MYTINHGNWTIHRAYEVFAGLDHIFCFCKSKEKQSLSHEEFAYIISKLSKLLDLENEVYQILVRMYEITEMTLTEYNLLFAKLCHLFLDHKIDEFYQKMLQNNIR